ncbi:MAG: ABC transporter ATP-binding protein [Actinomycetales bacterium]|nr:ABC transporter ATP-binding protein [Actinomycetales bacterium]
MRISLDSVSVEWDGNVALNRVSLDLDQKNIAVIGANGSGKSTFARLLNGLVKPTSGRVLVGDTDVQADPKTAQRQAGFIFSNPDLQIIMPTVIEDVEFSLKPRKLGTTETSALARAALERFGIGGLADRRAHELSSGQKQLLALAAVSVTDPKLIIADEPTALLDLRNTQQVAEALFGLQEQQVVLVTHDLSLAARCDIAVRFEAGQLIEIGEPAEVIARYRRDYE